MKDLTTDELEIIAATLRHALMCHGFDGREDATIKQSILPTVEAALKSAYKADGDSAIPSEGA